MRHLQLTLLVVCAFFVLDTSAQSLNRTEAWNDIKTIQTNERTALHNRQESELKLLIQIQQADIAANIATGDNWRTMLKDHAIERENLTKRHAAERSEMTKTHAAERAVFWNPPAPTKPAS